MNVFHARLDAHGLCFVFWLSAFGFCEYKEPESTLRALRLLHELQVGEKKLLVKVDAKTKAQLDEWKAKKKSTSANGVSIIPVVRYQVVVNKGLNSLRRLTFFNW